MRTVPEFATACRLQDWLMYWFAAGFVAWLLLLLIAVGKFLDRVVELLTQGLGQTGAQVVGLILFLTAMFGPAVLGAWWVDRRVRRVDGACCPKCAKLLVNRQRVVATRCCHRCGGRVLADPDLAQGIPLRPLVELVAVERTGRRATGWLLGGFAAWVIGAIVYVVLTETVGGGRELGLFAGAVDDPTVAAVLDSAALFVLGFAPFIFATGRFLVLYRRAERHPGVRCPHCGGRVSVGLLRETGNCGHCGRTAVAGPVGMAGSVADG